ncbi:hypothetical protein ACOME3_003614 [Neoechinorhynchus agilis]
MNVAKFRFQSEYSLRKLPELEIKGRSFDLRNIWLRYYTKSTPPPCGGTLCVCESYSVKRGNYARRKKLDGVETLDFIRLRRISPDDLLKVLKVFTVLRTTRKN